MKNLTALMMSMAILILSGCSNRQEETGKKNTTPNRIHVTLEGSPPRRTQAKVHSTTNL